MFGARSAILVGGVTWLTGSIMNTELDFAIYGFAVSCKISAILPALK